MDLNKQFIKSKRPCADGFRWFLKHHHAGADYQPLLDALVRAGRIGDACWLLEQFGPGDAVLEVDALDATAIVFAGSLLVRGGIEVDTVLVAGGGIRAGGDVRAGGAIRAGESLHARRIEAGQGYGVYAGLAVRQDSWAACAQVRAVERPARLFSGHWEQP